MRLKSIKSLFHYSIMFIIFTLPLLMILISLKGSSINAGMGQISSFDNVVSYLGSVFDDFFSSDINAWYYHLVYDLLGFNYNSDLSYIIISYPLYCMWVVILDLLFDCIIMIPKLCHNWLRKLDKDNE